MGFIYVLSFCLLPPVAAILFVNYLISRRNGGDVFVAISGFLIPTVWLLGFSTFALLATTNSLSEFIPLFLVYFFIIAPIVGSGGVAVSFLARNLYRRKKRLKNNENLIPPDDQTALKPKKVHWLWRGLNDE